MKRALAAAALVLGCAAPVTEVMVVLDTDLTPSTDIDTVRVVVTRTTPGAVPTHDVVYDLRSGRYRFPGTLAVVPRDAADRTPIQVTVTGSRGGTQRLSVSATGTPTVGAFARLDVFLARRCLDASTQACAAGTVCGRTGCEPMVRDPLPPYTPPTTP